MASRSFVWGRSLIGGTEKLEIFQTILFLLIVVYTSSYCFHSFAKDVWGIE
jgi:hypothetical protein